MKKREGLIVLVVVAMVSLGAFCISKNAPNVKTVYPSAKPILHNSDYIVQVDGGKLSIGQTSLADAKRLLPKGKDLGMSTVYKSSSPECILTFNKDQTVLKKLHLLSPELATARGISVGDPFSKVVGAYGKNYTYTGKALHAADFSAIYQQDENRGIIFQIENNKVYKIVLHEDIVSGK